MPKPDPRFLLKPMDHISYTTPIYLPIFNSMIWRIRCER
jgi:hypothetical protein